LLLGEGSRVIAAKKYLSPRPKPHLHFISPFFTGDRKATGTFREEWAAPCGRSRRPKTRRSPKGSIQGREPFARCCFAACPCVRRPPGLQAAREGRVDKLDFVTAARGALLH